MSNVITSKSIDNSNIQTIIETTIEEYEVVDLKVADGSAALPSITFTDDNDLGFYRLGNDNLGITTGGTRAMNFSGSICSSANEFRVEYQGGNPMLCFENDGGTGECHILVDASDNFILNNSKTFADIFFQTSNAGQVIMRPLLTTVQNIDFEVQIGDGVSSYTPLFQVSEASIRSREEHLFIDGVVGSPGISFNNDTNSGVRRIGSDNIGLVCGGKDVIDISQGATEVVSSELIHKPLTVLNTTVDFAVQVGDGISTYQDVMRVDETGVTLADGLEFKIDVDGSANAMAGKAVLSSGSVTINNNFVQSSSIILVNYELNAVAPSNPGHLYISAIVGDTSFTVSSTNASDNGKINYFIISSN